MLAAEIVDLEILDILFKPQYAGSLQCLKLEVGGDGHSTISTESSHMHTEDEEPSFKRGWVMWLLQEAVRRNPDIKVGGLSWTLYLGHQIRVSDTA
eukprot:COSAG02_NODE_617_length_19476_cov_158.404913_3_plen_96_part_00